MSQWDIGSSRAGGHGGGRHSRQTSAPRPHNSNRPLGMPHIGGNDANQAQAYLNQQQHFAPSDFNAAPYMGNEYVVILFQCCCIDMNGLNFFLIAEWSTS